MDLRQLFHHGIKGQRWGVRRFQNEDGTLTDIGKKRYNNDVKELESDYRVADTKATKAILDGTSNSLNSAGNAIGNIGRNKSKSVNKADYSKLSDSEIRERINRLSMERTYGELTGDTKRTRSGADWSREVLQTVGAVAGIGATIAGTILTIKTIKMGTKDKNKGGNQ